MSNVKAVSEELPHYRFFEFKGKNNKVIIRPDAGIEHGWFLSSSANKSFNERTNANSIVKLIKKENSKLLYTISVE